MPYDKASEDMARLEAQFTELSKKYKRELGCSVNYWGTGKNRYIVYLQFKYVITKFSNDTVRLNIIFF